jgi:hypothetical protein
MKIRYMLRFIGFDTVAHKSNVEERNSEFQRISELLFVRRPKLAAAAVCVNASVEGARSSNVTRTALNGSDLVVWLGDLNYRIQDERTRVDFLINQKRYMVRWATVFWLLSDWLIGLSDWGLSAHLTN